MGLKSYISDIVEAVVTTAKGMRITARYGVSPREEITQQYPEERREPPDRSRGFLRNDVKVCTGCGLCVKACPVDAISMETVRGADKRFVLVSYDINIGRCMYCGLCVEVCAAKSLKHSKDYERASRDRGELILHFVQEPAAEIKARVARQVAEAAAKAAAAPAAPAAAGAGTAPAAPVGATGGRPGGAETSRPAPAPPAGAARPAEGGAVGATGGRPTPPAKKADEEKPS